MRFFLISDNTDTQTGMRLAGIEGVVAHTAAEVAEALNAALDQPETGIVYANLKPRKKKQDIAKELGVSRTTLWRMEKMAREQKKQ